MLKNNLLNSALLYQLSKLGHSDSLVIADCGLPIPSPSTLIDLAVSAGQPSFITMVQLSLDNAYFEGALLADELKANPLLLNALTQLLYEHNPKMVLNFTPHSQFKTQCALAGAIVRTGEQTPYANIILYAAAGF
jgi:D-ribose pyranase